MTAKRRRPSRPAIPAADGFARVDEAPDPSSFEAYLARLAAHPEIRRYKARALALLDLRAGERVLDAGCGLGLDLPALLDGVGPGGEVLGIDRSARMIEQARRAVLASNVRLQVADVEDTGLPAACVDVGRCDRVLVHVRDPGQALRELRRVVRPGGRVVVTEADWATLVVDAPRADVTATIVAESSRSLLSPHVGRSLPRGLMDAGFRVVVVAAENVVLRDFEVADAFWNLTDAATRAVRRGLLDPAEARAWLRHQHEASARGCFLCALTGFAVVGARAGSPDV